MPHKRRRRIRVYTREVLVRLSAFRATIILFAIGVTIGSVLLRLRYDLGLIESIYQTVTLMFFASTLDYPKGDMFYEILWIMFPLFGLLMLAQSLEGIGSAIRFGDTTSEEWNREVVKVMNGHIVIIGIGNLGIRVLEELATTGQDLVIIDTVEDHLKEDLLQHYQRKYRIPLVRGDATQEYILKQANISKARAAMILIDDDLTNLKVATKARKLCPDIKLILRMFDLEFGRELADTLNFSLFSTTKIAVDHFINELGLDRMDHLSGEGAAAGQQGDEGEKATSTQGDPLETSGETEVITEVAKIQQVTRVTSSVKQERHVVGKEEEGPETEDNPAVSEEEKALQPEGSEAENAQGETSEEKPGTEAEEQPAAEGTEDSKDNGEGDILPEYT